MLGGRHRTEVCVRVGIFHPSFEQVGGAELVAARHATFLRQHGIEVRIATFAFDPTRWQEHLGDIPVDCVVDRWITDAILAWSRLTKMQRRGRRASHYLRDCDLVVAHNHPCSAMLGASTIRARKVWYCEEPPRALQLRGSNPSLLAHVESADNANRPDACVAFAKQLQEHDQEIAQRRSLHARQMFDLASIRKLDEVCANSEFTRDNVQRIYGRHVAAVMPPMVQFPGRAPQRSGLDRSGLKILVVSRLEPLKNIDTVLRGFAQFQRAVCPSAQVHVVGEGRHRQRLQELAHQLCPEGAIRFHGYLTDAEVDALGRACDVFALLAIDEPFGMVFPEAAANGLLLIGPDHGGPMEILDGGRLGWVCDAFSPAAFAARLEEIWALDDQTVNAKRAEADRACRARYAPEVVGPQLLQLLGHSVAI